jgi:hypothetical protein
MYPLRKTLHCTVHLLCGQVKIAEGNDLCNCHNDLMLKYVNIEVTNVMRMKHS